MPQLDQFGFGLTPRGQFVERLIDSQKLLSVTFMSLLSSLDTGEFLAKGFRDRLIANPRVQGGYDNHYEFYLLVQLRRFCGSAGGHIGSHIV